MLAGHVSIDSENAELFENLQLSNLNLEMAYDVIIEDRSQAQDMCNNEAER